MDPCLLLPAAFTIRYNSIAAYAVTLGLMGTVPYGICPQCRKVSHKVHSYYERKVTDLPMSGKTVHLRISVRKFFCQQSECSRKIFAERFDDCLPSYQRRLQRSNVQIQQIGLSCGSKPGAKLCQLIGLPVSASTVLRIMKKIPIPEVTTPKVLGIDDFAFRKGNSYGTILVDLEQRKVIDLLPDREGETLQAWLTAHPGVGVVTRDRSAVYALAVTEAVPGVVQVADRWHLLKNLSENLERYLDTQRTLIKEVAGELNQASVETLTQRLIPDQTVPLMDSAEGNPVVTACGEPVAAESSEKRYPKYQQVKQLQQQGYSRRAIARHVGLSRNTVNGYFRQDSFVPKVYRKQTNLLEFEPYLRKRWSEGETCIKHLLKEIKPMGYTGSYTILTQFLAKYPKTPNPNALPPAQKGTTYSSRSLSIALCQKADDWKEEQKPFLVKLLQKRPILRQARELNLEFKSLMESKKGEELESWCQKAEQLPLFKGFVRGIRQDFAAVQQAMTSTWSNGQTEGQVNRLKNIKRQMYGKADFDLLRVLVRSG